MSAADTIERAAAGDLPEWAEMRPERRAHAARVAALMDAWAARLGLSSAARARWRAVGWLHDALRDADAAELRDVVPPDARNLPDPVLHGPAAAARLAQAGVSDGALLAAVAHHTLGHPDLDRLGRALYAADFLEPGRTFVPAWRAGLRARMPDSFHAVVLAVVRARIRHRLERRQPVNPDTLAFWNRLAARS